MPRSALWVILFVLVCGVHGRGQHATDPGWPAWRGPLGTGEAPAGDPPVTFSETTNVAWKTPIPGSGASTPIIWGDTIYLQTSTPVGPEKPLRQTTFAASDKVGYVRGTPRNTAYRHRLSA